MNDRTELARLTVTPSFGAFSLAKLRLKLIQQGNKCIVEETEQQGRSSKRHRIMVPLEEVTQRFHDLKKVNIPAFPVSPLVMDGEYVELTIFGEHSTLSLGWWTTAPEGAEGIREFAEWLRSHACLCSGAAPQ
ncbi:MAG: hypothetical protein RQ722_12910 [Desulfuromonadales bacterium]|nr:hypothetical protein [Desulfuromonadales bacterium]